MIMIMKVQLVCLQRVTAVTVTVTVTAAYTRGGAPTDRGCDTLQSNDDDSNHLHSDDQ